MTHELPKRVHEEIARQNQLFAARLEASRLQAGRSCGECQMCCEVLTIEQLQKPRNTVCRHQCEAGCAIYESRPEPCARYHCAWLDGFGLDEDRPDKSGLFFETLMCGDITILLWCSDDHHLKDFAEKLEPWVTSRTIAMEMRTDKNGKGTADVAAADDVAPFEAHALVASIINGGAFIKMADKIVRVAHNP